MQSLRAWEYAGSAMSLKSRGVYLSRRFAGQRVAAVLSRQRILDLFAELDAELCASAVRGDVFVVGGAAMAVAYDARAATRDVDAIWHESSEVQAPTSGARVSARATTTSLQTG